MAFYKIIQGDCLEILPKMKNECIDMVVTDPPYGFGRFKTDNKDFIVLIKKAFKEIKRILKQGHYAFVFSGTGSIIDVANVIDLDFQRLLWMYKPNDETYPWRGWLLKSEAILVFTKGKSIPLEERKPYRHDCYVHTGVGKEGVEGHPTVKPLSVVSDLVSRCKERGVVFDPFLGSGTTMIACKKLNRSCIGIEIEPKYVKIAKERLKNFSVSKKLVDVFS